MRRHGGDDMGSGEVSGDGVNGYFFPLFCSHTSGVTLVIFFYEFCEVGVLFWFSCEHHRY